MNSEGQEPEEDSIIGAYQAVNQHWSHAEQVRWSILYNFLMANTILLLAWAAVFGSASSAKTPVLLVLSFAGAVISVLWVTIGCRVNTFVKRYGELGELLEDRLHLHSLGPFHRGEQIREEEKTNKPKQGATRSLMEIVGALIPTRVFVLVVPALFAGIYVALFVLS